MRFLSKMEPSFDFTKTLSKPPYNFKNIIITTEAFGLDLAEMPWIKAIIKKDPPWNLGLSNNKEEINHD